MTKDQTVHGHAVPLDEKGRVNLTELYRMAGKPHGKEPSRYKRLKRARPFLFVAEWYAVRGRFSWARIMLANDYADYIGLKPIAEPEPEPRSKFDDVWEKHQKWLADYAREQAEWDAGAEKREQQRQEHADAWKRLFDALDSLINKESYEGEEWKGEDYSSDTAGEEWKSAGDVDQTDDQAGDGRGPDHLFTDFIDLPGFLKIRASVN